MKKSILLATMAVTLTGVALWGATSVSAQTNGQELITKIAQKFNLQESDVKAVFDEARQQRQANMEKRLEEKLTQAVKDGKITETQKQAIITKMKELQSKRASEKESMKNMTPEQRKEAREKEKAELEAWAKSNGIAFNSLQGILTPKGFMHAVK